MSEIKRIKIKEIYPGKAALFGLGLGFFLGIIFAIILIILSMLNVGEITFEGRTLDFLNPGFVSVISVLTIIASSLLSAFILWLFAFFYNLVCKIGLNLDLRVTEVEDKNTQEFHLDERLKNSFY